MLLFIALIIAAICAEVCAAITITSALVRWQKKRNLGEWIALWFFATGAIGAGAALAAIAVIAIL